MPGLFAPQNRSRRWPIRRGPKGGGYANVVSASLWLYPLAASGYIDVHANNVGGDHNEVWRYTSGTAAIRLTKTLPLSGTFRDYAVASGITYFYYVRAVNADGNYADSAVQTASVALSDPWIFAITKGSLSNLSGTAYTLKAVEPQSRPVNRREEILFAPARTKPIVATGEIASRSWSVQVLSPNLSLSDATTLESLAALKMTLCIRDTYGRLMFGTIKELPVSYGITSVVGLTLQATDYHLHVA